MKGLAVVLLLTAAFLAFVGGASAETNAQAFQKARACLVGHGAREVRAWTPYGGGALTIGHWPHEESASWHYSPTPGVVGHMNPQVSTVSVAFFSHRWTAAARNMVIACVRQSLGPAGRVSGVTEE